MSGKWNREENFEIKLHIKLGSLGNLYNCLSSIFRKILFSYILNIKTWPKPTLSSKKWFFWCLHLIQKLGLLLKQVKKFWEVQKSLLTRTRRTGKFRSQCSQEREEPGSSEAISCQFANRYLSSASSNFFGNRDPVMLSWLNEMFISIIIIITIIITIIIPRQPGTRSVSWCQAPARARPGAGHSCCWGPQRQGLHGAVVAVGLHGAIFSILSWTCLLTSVRVTTGNYWLADITASSEIAIMRVNDEFS